jgi:hypothetical protein
VCNVLAATTRAAAGGRTKSSSVAPNVAFLGESLMSGADMSMRSVFLASLLNSASKVERKGLRDMGRLAVDERSRLAGECSGEAALRKGLLEESSSESPGDGRRS